MIVGKSAPSCILLFVEDSGADASPDHANFGQHLKDRCGVL